MNNRPKITLKIGIHKKQSVILIEFPYHLQVMDVLRQNTSATWSRTLGCLHIPELLRQESSETTWFYTHVSMKSLKNIKNPLNDFDL